MLDYFGGCYWGNCYWADSYWANISTIPVVDAISAGGGGRSDEGLFVPRDETLIFIMFAAMLADE
jgi:hypothetical protein